MNKDVLDFGNARKEKVVYLGLTLITLMLPIYKVSFFTITESFSGFSILFSGFNFIFLIIIIFGLLTEILPTLRDHELVVKNRKLLDIALPAIFTLMVVMMILQTRNAGMGIGKTTLMAYILVIAHVGYLLYDLGILDQVISKIKIQVK